MKDELDCEECVKWLGFAPGWTLAARAEGRFCGVEGERTDIRGGTRESLGGGARPEGVQMMDCCWGRGKGKEEDGE